jgi:hypothetical protein
MLDVTGMLHRGLLAVSFAAAPGQQQFRSPCLGGQGVVPYEQNTQQSPCRGCSRAVHAGHSWKKTHASVGICSVVLLPQFGHSMVETRSIGASAVSATTSGRH